MTTLKKTVPIVEKNSKSINIQNNNAVAVFAAPHYVKIKAIKKLGKADVYNMEVAKHHNFSVNGGYIVHNCMDALRYFFNTFVNKPQLRAVSRSLLGF